MDKPIITYVKNAENNTNKIRLPKPIIEQWGNKFYLEVYQDKMILRPINKK